MSTRREERTRPGRPRVLYEAAAEPLDERALTSYRLLAQILASYLAGSERDPGTRAEEAGRAWGAHLVRKPPPFTSISKEETIDEVVRLHEQFGFRPELRRAKERAGDRAEALSLPGGGDDQAVVCPVHLGLMRGALAEVGAASKRIGSSPSPSQALASAT